MSVNVDDCGIIKRLDEDVDRAFRSSKRRWSRVGEGEYLSDDEALPAGD